jgi:regulator of RNase E activity RraA
MYSDYTVRKVEFEDNIGIKIGGRTINILLYADDTTILAEEKEDMEKLLKKAKRRERESRTVAEP